MKKIVNCLLFVSAAGAVIAAVLVTAHYYPDLGRSIPLCGGGAGSCAEVSELPYAVFLGIPVAAYGLFFYLVVLFTILIADAAGGRYYLELAALLLPLGALALIIDAGLGVTLILIRKFCLYCVATYGINIILFVLLFVLFRTTRKADGVSYRATLGGIFTTRADGPDRRASRALYVVCLGLLFFSVFSLSYALGIKTRAVKEDIRSYVEDFYKTPPAAIEFPESGLAVGSPDAPLTIYVFTDFLCSACFRLYQNEEALLKQFGGKIRFVHFNFPLDAACNGSVKRTVYPNSCVASRSMLAASEMGAFAPYLERHFTQYEEYKHNFSTGDAEANVGGLIDSGAFKENMESQKTADILARDIALAERLGIKGTPTLFVNGREIGGVLPREAMEMIVTRELSALESGKE